MLRVIGGDRAKHERVVEPENLDREIPAPAHRAPLHVGDVAQAMRRCVWLRRPLPLRARLHLRPPMLCQTLSTAPSSPPRPGPGPAAATHSDGDYTRERCKKPQVSVA